MNTKSQRAMICIGAAMAIMWGVGFGVLSNFFPPPSPALSADAAAHFYTQSNLRFRIGTMLMLLSGCFILPWAVVISVQMARHEEGVPVWAILQAIAGAVEVVPFFMAPVFWVVAAFSPERDPALVQLMQEAGFLTFVTAVCTITFAFIPIAVVCFTAMDQPCSAFPRWFGYLTLLMIVEPQLGVAAVLFKTGPFAWDGLFPFYLPVGLFGVWVTALLFLLLRSIRHQEVTATMNHFSAPGIRETCPRI